MFALIWATLLLCARGSNADTGTSVELRRTCDLTSYCITLPEELTAEAGLCVVIPCSFTVPYHFKPIHAVWYKCSWSKSRCGDKDTIFHTNNNNQKGDLRFRDRVSLLEPDVRQKNCSIVINDLKESDSGTYQFRAIGISDKFQFSPKVLISVKGLDQKPTMEIPPLEEGEEATLTCTAPGLCSGSVPEILWVWSGAGGSISGNITTLKIENLNAIANRYSSTLTFNSSAELHGTNITCSITFTDSVTTEETVTLNVTYIKDPKITGDISVNEEETLNLTCSVESFPPSHVTWMKPSELFLQNGTESLLQNDTSADLLNETETSQQETHGKNSLIISSVTTGDSGQYICNVKYLNKTFIKEVNVTVRYRRDLQLTGRTTVNDGDVLNLTCSAESFPPSLIIWTKLGGNTTLHTGPGSASFVIPSVTVEDSGQYVCTAVYLDTEITVHSDVAVTYIHNSSRCVLRSDVLTCVCISEGLPLPAIRWPLLNNHTEYSVITTVSKNTINSTVILIINAKDNTTVECVSGNENGELKKILPTEMKLSGKDDQSVLNVISRVEVIIAFLIGVVLSAFISCLLIKCHRRKQKTSGNLDEVVELVTNNNNDPLYYGQAVEDEHLYEQDEADNGTEAAEKTATGLDSESKDVEYADIDYSLLKRKTPGDEARTEDSTRTEYAEIKREIKEERVHDGEEENEMLESKEEEAVLMEAEETRRCLPEDEAAETEAVYSNVKEVMDEI